MLAAGLAELVGRRLHLARSDKAHRHCLSVLVRSVRSDHLQECRSNDCCHRAYEYHIDEDEGRIEHGTLPATRGFPIERLIAQSPSEKFGFMTRRLQQVA